MKILHTSDWHIGHILYGYDRLEEHRYFFDQFTEIALKTQPDAMVLCGDIFDVSTPSATVSRLFTDYILDLHKAMPDMTIVITSGNHDSASRIDVNHNLWKSSGIFVIGNVKKINREYDFSDNIISIKGKGTIVAIPYINRAFMTFENKMESQEKQFFELIAKKLSESNADGPVVLMAHLTIEGFDGKGHNLGAIGNIDMVSHDVFGEKFNYIALGHIHKPQNMDQKGRLRYSGSPVAINFDEDYPHSVSLIEISEECSPVITEFEIRQKRKLLTFPEKPESFKKAIKSLSKFSDTDESYIRLNVAQEEDLPSDCEELATKATSGKNCRYCTIKYTRLNSRPFEDSMSGLSASEFMQLTPTDIAVRFFLSKGLPEETSKVYIELLKELENEFINHQSI